MPRKRTLTKRASYFDGVRWIACNDNVGSQDGMEHSVVKSYISTALLADLFGADSGRVATDIIRERYYFLESLKGKTI